MRLYGIKETRWDGMRLDDITIEVVFVFPVDQSWSAAVGMLETMETEVRDLKDPSAVDEAIRRLKIAVRYDLAVMQVDHSLQRQGNARQG